MLVVPLKNDIIKTAEGITLKVQAYSRLKTAPIVYVDTAHADENPVVYFSDIEEINNAPVKLNSNNVFDVTGTIKRKIQLPEIGSEFDAGNGIEVLKAIKVQNKKVGISEGMVFCSDQTCYNIRDVIDLDVDGGFDKKKFMKYYDDYLPFG